MDMQIGHGQRSLAFSVTVQDKEHRSKGSRCNGDSGGKELYKGHAPATGGRHASLVENADKKF
jgi:hypothetical protein